MVYYSEINKAPREKFQDGGFKKTVDIYEELINEKTGKLELKKTGEDPFYQKIQEEVEGQLLETLIDRYKINLNDKKITQLTDELVDMTTMPADLIETYALAHKLEQQFNNTSADIKNYFGDFAGYLRSFQSGTLRADLEKIQSKYKKTEESVVPEAKPTAQAQPTAQASSQTSTTNNGGVING